MQNHLVGPIIPHAFLCAGEAEHVDVDVLKEDITSLECEAEKLKVTQKQNQIRMPHRAGTHARRGPVRARSRCNDPPLRGFPE